MLINQPLEINRKILRNRIVMPPMATGKAVYGMPSETQIDYYKERAKATAMIIVEHEYVSPEGMASKGQLSMADDSVIKGYKKLTETVHKEGAMILAQISHAGGIARDTEDIPIAPSQIVVRANMPTPKEMTKEDINRLIYAFTDAAVRAQKAGFDGVEIHAAHGYLLNQFYSPLTNHRTDEYTGSTMEGRTRFHIEIIKSMRKAVGNNFIVALRFGACDYMKGGSEIKDIPAAAHIFERNGIDFLDISGGHCVYTVKGKTEPGWFAELSKPAKQAVKIPVMLTGGIKTGEDAENLLKEHAADLIGVGRSMMQDAKWTQKALAELHWISDILT